MNTRRGMPLMAAAAIVLAGALPVAAQDELPVADCEAPSEPIGVAIFALNDYLSLIRDAIQGGADASGATIEVADGLDSQPTQNEQIDVFVARNLPAIAVAQANRDLAGETLEKAMAQDIPVVFFNTEPPQEVLESWDKTFYVGAKAEESGQMQGQLVLDYWNANPDADKNGDGVIQYVMLSGPAAHQDAEIRTVESIKYINDAGTQTEELAREIGNWNVPLAQEQMGAIYAQHGDAIEFVLANNDPMALGAIEALRANGYFGDDGKSMPVVGVDATAAALDSMRAGELYGTVLNDDKNQGRATFNLACVLAGGGTPTEENIGYPIEGKYVWIPYVPVGPDDL